LVKILPQTILPLVPCHASSGKPMRIPKYDIFSGIPGNSSAIWKETVSGLGAANDRMKELAALRPGPYFVFDASSSNIMAQIDTSAAQKHEKRGEG